jgi:hypothetical protein
MTHGLNIKWCLNITDEGLKHLKNITHGLNLECCNITDKGLKYLTNMTHGLVL